MKQGSYFIAIYSLGYFIYTSVHMAYQVERERDILNQSRYDPQIKEAMISMGITPRFSAMGKTKEQAKKRIKRLYTTKHSEDMIELALDAMKKKTMSSYSAEKVFGIPRRTLLDKLHNKHPNRPGCPTKLTEQEEADIIKVLIAAADYGSPLTLLDLRIVVHRYLEANGRLSIFNNKLPGKKWAYSFLKRNKCKLTYRVIQNIKRSRAEKSPGEMREYFTYLKSSLEGVPNENILNYDETKLSDNPGTQKCLFKRGVKYPERVLNYTKGAISIMFAITAGGECLPPYVVYKAEHLYTQWTINGPKGSRFNRSKSGWFDSLLFEDWFESIILPWAKDKTGTKVLIGDNLASHINHKIVTYCEQNNIRFVFLPPNSSHLTQPLDVCYFGPLKKLWREILLNYKIKNPRETTIHKGHFPDLLKQLVEKLNEKSHNINSAFKSTGIAPFNPDKVISKLPGSNESTATYTIDNALLDWLKETRSANPNKKQRNKKLNVPPGKSVGTNDFKDLITQPKNGKKDKKQKADYSKTTQLNVGLLIEPSFQNPESLKKLCISWVNTYLIIQNDEQTAQRSFVQNLYETKNDEANEPFIGELPECLLLNLNNKPTTKSKPIITSEVTFKAGSSQNIHYRKKINSDQKGDVKITRSALHMKLNMKKKENITEERKVLEEITQKSKEFGNIIKTVTPKKKIKRETATKAKKRTQKHIPSKEKWRRYSSESSSSESILCMADSDDSEYETMEDIITEEEQENIEPSIPYGVSEIEYFTEDNNKLNIDTWILAKFATKKSLKHFVGKVILMTDNIPDVKFVRKVKESKLDRGSVFTYPAVDDICTMKHLDDIVLILPTPNISRRGQIIFDIDLSNYNVQ